MAAAVGPIREVLSGIWAFEPIGQRWQLWSPVLPDALQGFTTLEPGRGYFAVTSAGAVWTFDGDAVSATEADALVQTQLDEPSEFDDAMLVLRHPEIVEAGASLTSAFPDFGGTGGLAVIEPSYLYWVDEAPGARRPVRP